ncbi:MAG: anaerobic ribonucleoside-triphosphate reductase [Geobacteraceae bacterium]|nr:anaerobic ribonucleoside-triphosphate reductase [Geobacteraceae bacterium]
MNGNDKNFEEIYLDDAERQSCEVWTRVMGYHRPVESFNIGKKAEYRQRRFFRESPAKETPCSPSAE